MSAPRSQRAPRIRDDAYFTPRPVAIGCAERVWEVAGGNLHTILEPSAGGGSFVRAARHFWPNAQITAVDKRVRPELRALRPFVAIQSTFERFSVGHYDLVIGNPPFNRAQQHVELALERLESRGHLAFLLRLGLLGGLSRATSLWAGPGLRHVAALAPRPSYTGGGTDNSEYALFIWQRGYRGPAELGRPLLWRRS